MTEIEINHPTHVCETYDADDDGIDVGVVRIAYIDTTKDADANKFKFAQRTSYRTGLRGWGGGVLYSIQYVH